MNLRLVSRLLGIIALLTGGMMVFSLPWAFPSLGYRAHLRGENGDWILPNADHIEWGGVGGILVSMAICAGVGWFLWNFGKHSQGERLYRKEAMAVVGLSWVLTTLLGALPFLFSGTYLYYDENRDGFAEDDSKRMTIVDAMFESQSGFSTTGATVISDLENFNAIEHCILFWRARLTFWEAWAFLSCSSRFSAKVPPERP